MEVVEHTSHIKDSVQLLSADKALQGATMSQRELAMTRQMKAKDYVIHQLQESNANLRARAAQLEASLSGGSEVKQ